RAQTGQRAGAGPAQGPGQIMWNESGERSRDRHATPKFSSALALLSEIPIENLGTVPSDHAISTENLFEGPLDMPDPVRHAGKIGVAGDRHDFRALGGLLVETREVVQCAPVHHLGRMMLKSHHDDVVKLEVVRERNDGTMLRF